MQDVQKFLKVSKTPRFRAFSTFYLLITTYLLLLFAHITLLLTVPTIGNKKFPKNFFYSYMEQTQRCAGKLCNYETPATVFDGCQRETGVSQKGSK